MHQSRATVTVFMPVYNAEPYVGAAITGILGQTWGDFEFVIVDDGSTDNSAAIVEEYAVRDSRILFTRANHQGVARARNRGLSLATGEIVVLQDADDVSRPERIRRQLTFLANHPEIAVVGGGMSFIDELGRPEREPALYAADPAVIEERLSRGYTPIANPTAAYRRDIVRDLGGYRFQFDFAEDYDLWLRIGEHHLMSNLREVLVDYRGHARNVSRRHRYEQHLAASVARLCARARRAGLPDPVDASESLCLADLERFDLSRRERAQLALGLAHAALASFKATGDKSYLAAIEDSLRLQPSSDTRTEQVWAQLARLLWVSQERPRSIRVAMRRSQVAVARLVRSQESDRRAVSDWLVHCSDPAGANGAPPKALLSVSMVEDLVAQATAHGVLPAVMRNFPDLDTDNELTAVRAEAQSRARLAAGFSLMLRQHADALVEDGAGLPFTVIKGPIFARLLYASPRLRPFTDIDLLVEPRSVPDVSELLAAHGFRLAESEALPTEWKWLHQDNEALLVEVQTNLVHSDSLSAHLSLAYRDLAGIEETPAAQLIVAIVHGALGAHFEKLRHAVDICQAARQLTSAREEESFLRLVDITGARLAAKTGLNLAAKFFREPRCIEIAQALGPERHAALACTLITPTVVMSMTTPVRSRHSWRRSGFRELLKRTHLRHEG